VELKGRGAIVTGGGTGLGRAISLKLAAGGANLAIVYSRSRQEAEQTAAECAEQGVKAVAIQADVAEPNQIEAMVEAAHAALGRLDILVNDAGFTIFVPLSDLDGYSLEEWDRVMHVNVRAHWLTARAAAPYLRQHGGAIVNITSIAGLRPAGSSLPYCVSKAAAIMLAKCLAAGLAPEIRVNNVAPGLLRTRWGARFSDEQFAQFEQGAALKRPTPVEDVADGVLFAIANDSLTGQTIVVDAGLHFH
jgi:3-oxoacyl-[acyl-carrier protein] reductase